jgi:hypothetical protein
MGTDLLASDRIKGQPIRLGAGMLVMTRKLETPRRVKLASK